MNKDENSQLAEIIAVYPKLEKNKMMHLIKVESLDPIKYKNVKISYINYLKNLINKINEYITSLEKEKSNKIKSITTILNNYKRQCKKHFIDDGRNKSEGLKSTGKYESSILEEFLYIFIKMILINKKVYSLQVGMAKCVDSIILSNFNNLNFTTKDVDFAVYEIKELEIDKKRKKVNYLILGCEIKTYIDATMFGNIEHTYTKLKKFSPYAEYLLVSETECRAASVVEASLMKNNEFILRNQRRQKDPLKIEDYDSKIQPIDNLIIEDIINRILNTINEYISNKNN